MPEKPPLITIECTLQNRLGALDRLLSAFTHRGIVPAQLLSDHDEPAARLRVAVTFRWSASPPGESSLEKALDKLTKSLQKHVYVIDARVMQTPTFVMRSPALESSGAYESVSGELSRNGESSRPLVRQVVTV
jgi:hypothetical protein